MIKQVYGKANDLDITFNLNEEKGLYYATVPRSLNGSYYVELYAEDIAGNVSYMATALFEFDPSTFKCKIKIVDYVENSSMKDFRELVSKCSFRVESDKKEYEENLSFVNDYDLEVVKICCL